MFRSLTAEYALRAQRADHVDLHEAVADWRTNREAAVAYLRATIDRIIELMPRLALRLDGLFSHVA